MNYMDAMDTSPIVMGSGDTSRLNLEASKTSETQARAISQTAMEVDSERVLSKAPDSSHGTRAREDDVDHATDLHQRPLKRARTLESQTMDPKEGTRHSGASTTSAPRIPLTKELQEQAERSLNMLCKIPGAEPFLAPVDPVVSKAPNYYQLIKDPMDFGTINQKLKRRTGPQKTSSSYQSFQDFVDDVELVFMNCFTYNGVNHAVSQLALRIKDTFEYHIRTGPGGKAVVFPPVPESAPTATAGIQSASGSSGGKEHANTKPMAISSGQKRTYLGVQEPPPGMLDTWHGFNRRDPLRIMQMKFCKTALDHLYKKENESSALPFLNPVDLAEYPDYRKIIKQPIDFGIISDRLSHGTYLSPKQFWEDVKLVFSNCYTYNADWMPVYQCACKLEAIFDKKWEELPLTAPEGPIPVKRKRSSGGSNVPGRTAAHKDRTRESQKKQGKKRVPIELNLSQKVALCEMLVQLSPRKMDQIIDLIRKRISRFRDNKEEMTLGFEELPPLVQGEMYAVLRGLIEKKEGYKRRADSDSSLTSFSSNDELSEESE